MTCRVACQPQPRRHWPTFSPPDLPAGLAECLVCGDWITAVDLLEGMCAGPFLETRQYQVGDIARIFFIGMPSADMPDETTAEGCPVESPMAVVPEPEGKQPINGGLVTVAPLSVKHSDQLNALRSVDVSPVQADGSCSESREPGHLDPVSASPGRSESATGHAFIDARDLERERTLAEIRRCAEHQL